MSESLDAEKQLEGIAGEAVTNQNKEENGKKESMPTLAEFISMEKKAKKAAKKVKKPANQKDSVAKVLDELGPLPPRDAKEARKLQKKAGKSNKRSKQGNLLPGPHFDPLSFLQGHRRIMVLGEEDFSLSYEISTHNCYVLGAAYKPNEYAENFMDKLRANGGMVGLECDAQDPRIYKDEKWDAVVFTFPRLLESLGKETIGTKYFEMNQTFFAKWLSNARDHLTPGGRIYIVLIPNQFDEWKLNEVCVRVKLQWALLGDFHWQNCLHYKPKNEKGEAWEPRNAKVFSIFPPPSPPPDAPLYLPPRNGKQARFPPSHMPPAYPPHMGAPGYPPVHRPMFPHMQRQGFPPNRQKNKRKRKRKKGKQNGPKAKKAPAADEWTLPPR